MGREDKGLKLLQVGPYPPPIGGWSFHIQVFQRYLNDLGVENQVLDIGENRTEAGRDCIPVLGAWDLVHKVASFTRRGWLPYLHFNGTPLKGMLLTLLAQLVALGCGRRVLLSFHAGVVQRCFEPGWNPQKMLCGLIFFLAKGCICNSEEVKEKICRTFHRPQQSIFAIPCFSRQYIAHEQVLTAEEEGFLQGHSPLLCSYLFFREEYDPQTLLAALPALQQEFPGLGLVIIGDAEGAETYMDSLPETVKSCIFLAGGKDHDGFLSLVERCDLMVRTPLSDGVASSLMEALALGVPVVACDNGTRPSEVLLYGNGDVAGLVAQSAAVLHDTERYRAALEKFTPRDAIVEEYEFLLDCRGEEG